MLHNTGPYGPNEVPANHPNPVNMSPLGGHINMSHNINNLSKSGQQSVQTVSGHYNLPEYPGYSQPPLNMSPQIGHIPLYPQIGLQHHYLPQNSTSAGDMTWQNSMVPMNLNVQHDHNINSMNYHNHFDKRLLDSAHDDYKETTIRKVPLNIPQIPIKTSHKHISSDNYAYNDNYEYSDHNLDLSMKPQDKLPLDSTRRRNIENTVRLIENILIKSSKNKVDDNNFIDNDNVEVAIDNSNIYSSKLGSTSITYVGKPETSSATSSIYNTKIGSTSEPMHTTKIVTAPDTANIYSSKSATPNIFTSKVGSTTEPTNLNTNIRSTVYNYNSKSVSSEPNICSTKVGSTSESNIFTSKTGSMPEKSIIHGNKPAATSEIPSNYSTKVGSTSESNISQNKPGLEPRSTNIHSKPTTASSENTKINNSKIGSTTGSKISNSKIGSTTTNIYSKVIPSSEASNVFRKSASNVDLYNDKKVTSTTVMANTYHSKPDQESENNNDETSEEESSSENNEKPAVDDRDRKEIVIESKIEIKVENTTFIDMDFFQPFLRDSNGVQRDDVDCKIIDGETSVEEATAAIKTGVKLESYYECPHCTLLFDNPKRFLVHTKWHTFGLTYEKRMEVAREREERKQAKREAKVLERMNAKEVTDVPVDGKVFPCKDCDKVFSAKGSLKNHRKRTHPTRSRDCKICRKTIIGWTAMRAHVATHTCSNSGGYQCMECPKRFKYSHSLAKHKDTHLEKTHGCTECPKMFGSQALLKMHMKTHERVQRGTTFRCTYCGKGFYECYSLQVHERTHRNERPFNCEICNTSFGTNSSLKRHMKVSHSTSKPHECEECHRSFSTERIRDRHHSRVHARPEDFRFPCTQCSCKYLKLKDLQKHVYKVHPKNTRRKKAQSDSE